MKVRLNSIYSEHTGKPVDEIRDRLERDHFMSSEEALEYGINRLPGVAKLIYVPTLNESLRYPLDACV